MDALPASPPPPLSPPFMTNVVFLTSPSSHSWIVVLRCHQVATASPSPWYKRRWFSFTFGFTDRNITLQAQSPDFQRYQICQAELESIHNIKCSFYVTVGLVCDIFSDNAWLRFVTSLIFNFPSKWTFSAHYKYCILLWDFTRVTVLHWHLENLFLNHHISFNFGLCLFKAPKSSPCPLYSDWSASRTLQRGITQCVSLYFQQCAWSR